MRNLMLRGATVAYDGEPTGGTGGAGDTKWFAALDADTQAAVTTLGVADKTAAEAFAVAAKSHREAQAYIGVPKDQLLALPKADAGPDEWKPIWKRFGAPDDAAGYDFSAIKPAAGDLDTALADRIRAAAVANNLPVKAAQEVVETFVKYEDERAARTTQEREAKVTADREGLRTSWGQNYDANMVLAKNAATALGVDAETVSALEKVVGYPKVMELFRNVGTKIGEDKFVAAGGISTGGLHTAASAREKIAENMADPVFAKNYLAGGATERKEMDSLHAIAAGVQQK